MGSAKGRIFAVALVAVAVPASVTAAPIRGSVEVTGYVVGACRSAISSAMMEDGAAGPMAACSTPGAFTTAVDYSSSTVTGSAQSTVTISPRL